MKIIRFKGSYSGSPYAYVKCWPWEKIAILRKMKRRPTGLHLVTWEPVLLLLPFGVGIT